MRQQPPALTCCTFNAGACEGQLQNDPSSTPTPQLPRFRDVASPRWRISEPLLPPGLNRFGCVLFHLLESLWHWHVHLHGVISAASSCFLARCLPACT